MSATIPTNGLLGDVIDFIQHHLLLRTSDLNLEILKVLFEMIAFKISSDSITCNKGFLQKKNYHYCFKLLVTLLNRFSDFATK